MNYDTKIDMADGADPDADANPLDYQGEDERRSNRRMWLFAGLAILVLVALWYLAHREEPTKIGNKEGAQVPLVTVIAPGSATVLGRISATGTLAARRELPVGSVGEGGLVERVLVDAGDWVRAGQVLAIIDRSVQSQQQESLSAQIQVAQADARLAQANLDRALKLVDRGFISKADVDRLTATRDSSGARVRVARAQLGEMQARTRRLNILAPASGLVLDRNVEPGQVVSSGSGALFRIAKDGEMEMLAKLSEADLGSIASGVMAKVTPVGSGKTFDGQIWQVAPIIDPQTRQGEARIALAYAPELRPGGFANAEIIAGSIDAPLLPESAVLSDAKGSYVYIIDAGNKARRRDVKTGMITADGIVIESGLSGSEQIVMRAGAFLSDGEAVKALRAKPGA